MSSGAGRRGLRRANSLRGALWDWPQRIAILWNK